MENLSASFAWSGSISEISMPETFVLMGLNSPRISEGASGFMSYMSMWLGPPPRQIMMTDLSRFPGGTAPSALSRRNGGSVNPPSASAPVFKKLRRESPSQNRPDLPLKKVNMQRRQTVT